MDPKPLYRARITDPRLTGGAAVFIRAPLTEDQARELVERYPGGVTFDPPLPPTAKELFAAAVLALSALHKHARQSGDVSLLRRAEASTAALYDWSRRLLEIVTEETPVGSEPGTRGATMPGIGKSR